MDRKRIVIIVAIGLAVVVLAAAGIAALTVWPMISGEVVAAGPAPAEEEFAETPLARQVAVPDPAAVPALGAASGAPEPGSSKASDAGDGNLLAGWWICSEGNDLQPEGSQYYFQPSEDDENSGLLLYYDDPELDPNLAESWVEAAYRLSEDGLTLAISPTTVGFAEREYEVGFGAQEWRGRTYHVMQMAPLAEGDESMAPAVLFKYEAADPAWDEWVPEPFDPEVYVEATEEQFAVAQEIIARHYPAFEVVAAWYVTNDPAGEYIGDNLHVAAGMPDTGIAIGQWFVIAPADVDDFWWLEPGAAEAVGAEAGVTADGTRYLLRYSIEGVEQEDVEPEVIDLLATVCWDFPGAVVDNLYTSEEPAWVTVSRWDAFPGSGGFDLAYTYNADESWWELTSSQGMFGPG